MGVPFVDWSNVAIDGSNEVQLPDWHPSYDEYEAYRQQHPELNLPEQKKPTEPPDEKAKKRNPNSGAVAKHVPAAPAPTPLRTNGTMGRIYVMPYSIDIGRLLPKPRTKDELEADWKYHEEAKAWADAEGKRISAELDKARWALNDTSFWDRSQRELRTQIKERIASLENQLSARGSDALYAREQSVRAFNMAYPELANQPTMSASHSSTERYRLNELEEARKMNDAMFNAALKSPFALGTALVVKGSGGKSPAVTKTADLADGLFMGLYGRPTAPTRTTPTRTPWTTETTEITRTTPTRTWWTTEPPPAPRTPTSIGSGVTIISRGRLPQDVSVNPVAPRPNPDGKVGTNENRAAEMQKDIDYANAQKADDIRVGQEQVNAAGDRVGVNKPHLQYTIGNQRYYIRYDTAAVARAEDYASRILANDSAGKVILKTIE